MGASTSSFFLDTISRVREYYRTYPSITRKDEICAYYKAQILGLPSEFLGFTMVLVISLFFCDILFICDGMSLSNLRRVGLGQSMLVTLCYLISCFMDRMRQSACAKESKKSLELQRTIHSKMILVGFFPAAMLTLSPVFQPITDRPEEICSLGWLLCTILNMHCCTWFMGGLAYHIFLMLLFNAAHCGIAIWKGYFTIFLYSKIFAPVVMSTLFFIALDRYNKENFLLRRALKQQKRMYQKFLELMQDPVLICGQDASPLFHNRAADSLIVPHNNIDGLRNIFSPTRRVALETDVKRRLGQPPDQMNSVLKERYYGSIANGEEEQGRGGALEGRRRVLDVTLIESTAFSGSQKTVSLVLHDVTEELEKEGKRAEEKYKNMLLFSLSHELKTPLNIFQGFLCASKEWISTDQMRSMLQDAKGAWRYLRNKINDILDYAQILSNEFALHQSKFPLRRFVEYLRKVTICLLIGKRGKIRLDFFVDPALPDDFEGDRERLEQVLFDFLCNATRFTERGTISLIVTRTGDRIQPTATFEVKDTGCGMNREMTESLFRLGARKRSGDIERLLLDGDMDRPERGAPREESKEPTRQDSTRKRSTGRSGLGLTVSKMICEKMGCDISVVSEVGKGSSFSFSLPATSKASVEVSGSLPMELIKRPSKSLVRPETREQPESSGEVVYTEESVPDENADVEMILHHPHTKKGLERKFPSPHPRALSITTRITMARKSKLMALIVDDNYFNRFVAEFMIKKLGIATSMAENGKIAVEKVEKLRTENPNSKLVVFMDVDMPVMDGIQATTIIRSQNGGPRPYIIALTAFAAESERVRCSEAGMDAFIGKPLTKERLQEVLEAIEQDNNQV